MTEFFSIWLIDDVESTKYKLLDRRTMDYESDLKKNGRRLDREILEFGFPHIIIPCHREP